MGRALRAFDLAHIPPPTVAMGSAWHVNVGRLDVKDASKPHGGSDRRARGAHGRRWAERRTGRLAGLGLRHPVADARSTRDGRELPPCRSRALETVNERRAAVRGKGRHVCEGPPEHIPLTRGPPKIVRVHRGEANYVPARRFPRAREMREFAAPAKRTAACGATSSYRTRSMAASMWMDPDSGPVPPSVYYEMWPDTCEGSPK